MLSVVNCSTPACTATIDITDEWKEGEFCKYIEAECIQCLQLYWVVKRDNTLTLRDRDRDINFLDHRDSNR